MKKTTTASAQLTRFCLQIAGWLTTFVAAGGVCHAALLTDAEMYCDPWTIPYAERPTVNIPDLAQLDTHVWDTMGDPVIAAKILPPLRTGSYSPGYVFSQSDYYLTPNVDYTADLTRGTLTVTFASGGLYHVTVNRQSGNNEVYAVWVQSYSLQQTSRTGRASVIDLSNVDLFVVSDTPDINDDPEEQAYKILTDRGKNVRRASSHETAVAAINDALKGQTKKHVELVGHGNAQGQFKFGKDWLDVDTAAGFASEISEKVSELSFIACEMGRGEAGDRLTARLTANGLEKVVLYPGTVASSATKNGGYFMTVELPEPATLSGFALVAIVLGNARIRRSRA